MAGPDLAAMQAKCAAVLDVPAQSAALCLLGLVLVVSVVIHHKLRASRQAETDDWLSAPPLKDLAEALSPLLCGLLLLGVFLGALTFSGFYGAPVDAKAFEFMGVADKAGKDIASEQSARGLWGVTVALLLLAEVAMAWTVAGLWVRCPGRWKFQIAIAGLAVAVVSVVMMLTARSLLGVPREFGSKLVGDLVCIVAFRSELLALGPFTDGLNAVGLVAPLLVGFGFCLVLIPQEPSPAVVEAHETDAARKQRESAQLDASLQWHAGRQRKLDQILYVGAAVLVAGLMEIVTLVSWSHAPFEGTAELKARVDLCKSTEWTKTTTVGLSTSNVCEFAAPLVDDAQRVDDARRFTQTLALMYGATFSSFLLAFYLPAALILQERLRMALLSQASQPGQEELSAKLTRFDVDRTPVKQGITLAVSLGPMIAGIVASLLKL